MSQLTPQRLVDAGTAPTFGAAGASDRADCGSGTNTFLHYKNSSGGSVTVTVLGVGTTDYGVAMPNNVLTLAATTGELLVPLHKDQANSDGLGATITTSAQSGVTVALVRH